MQALLSSSWEEARPPPSTQSERLRVAIDILDTLWETESFLKKLSMKDMDAVKKFMKDNRKLLASSRKVMSEVVLCMEKVGSKLFKVSSNVIKEASRKMYIKIVVNTFVMEAIRTRDCDVGIDYCNSLVATVVTVTRPQS